MKSILQNKNIVITGASSGIGAEIAKKAAAKGARPILLARSKHQLHSICAEINNSASVDSLFFELDVSDFKNVHDVFQQIFAQVGHIDMLVNNAGFGIFDLFHKANFDDVKQMFDVNVLGLMACTKAVLPSMMSRNSGHIINIASQAGKLATPKSSGYSASKHAVLGFTNSLRLELVDTNIHVSAVNPGPIRTRFFDIADKSGNYVKNVEQFMLEVNDVADKIIQLMERPKRELNLPWWMNVGGGLYNLMPAFIEKIAGRSFKMK